MEQANLTRLRQQINDHFDLEELRTLSFDLGAHYDDLRGEGRANKARELIAYLQRRGRIAELVARCAHLRPNAVWQFEPDATPTAPTEPEYIRPVGQGMTALTQLMQNSRVHDAVAHFRADFEAACEQVDVLDDYKHLHDLLHKLQFHCYNLIVQESWRFPDDDMAVDGLINYEMTLQQIVGDLRTVAQQAAFPETETLWVQDLVRAREALSEAIEQLDAQRLQRAIWLLNRVLSNQPSRINIRLNATARALRLPALVEAMAKVSDNLAMMDLDSDQVDQFEAGVDALVGLNHNLTALVDDHDRWQVIDVELRRIEASIEHDTIELEMSWPDLKSTAEPLYTDFLDEWAAFLRQDSERLDSALATQNPARIKRHFRRYRRQVGSRFHRVDVDLKRLCTELRTIGEPMAAVMRMAQ